MQVFLCLLQFTDIHCRLQQNPVYDPDDATATNHFCCIKIQNAYHSDADLPRLSRKKGR